MMANTRANNKGRCFLLFLSPLTSLVAVVLCVVYAFWLQKNASHINELGKRRMLTYRNLKTVFENAIFNKSSNTCALADQYIASPGNSKYAENVRLYTSLLEKLIAQSFHDLEFESMYFRTARAANSLVESINLELDSNTTMTRISTMIFATIICTMVVAVATSLNMMCETKRLLRRVHNNLKVYEKRLNALPIMVYEFSMKNGNSLTFDYTSNGAHAIYGTDINAAQEVIDMIHESERQGFMDSMKVSSEQLTPWIWKGRITNACGEEKTISFQSIPERISPTHVTWTGAMQDITELHNTLQTMERRLEFVPVFELVLRGEQNTEVLYLTSVAADILGRKQKAETFDILEYIIEGDRDRVLTSLKNSAPGTKWVQEFTTISGSRARGYAKGRLNNTGETVWTGVLDDVGLQHDLVHVRRERDLQNAVAEQLQRRCNFLAHEVRNTLFPHKMMLEDMTTRYPDIKENVELMQAGYRTVGEILDRALMIAKYEVGEMTTKSIRFNLVLLCRSLEAYARAAAVRDINQQITVVYKFSDDDDIQWVVGDRQVCEQAATNLLSNAIKYGAGKPLKMHLSYDGKVFTFTVTDKGRGMTADDLKTACVPFGTIRTGNDQTKGTGLGLPLTHAMVVNAGGSLSLRSKGLGQGTVVIMRLPLVRSTSSGKQITTQPPEVEDLPVWLNECKNSPLPVRVLLVDDSPLILKMMSHACTKIGLPFDTAVNGQAALELLTQQHKQYTLVLMDRCMPDIQGNVVCQRARESGYKGVVVLLTGDQIPDPTSMMQQFGLSGILCKSGQRRLPIQDLLKQLVV